MKQVTLSNAIQCAIAIVFTIAALVVGICTMTGHNIFFGAMFGCVAWVMRKAD